MRTRYTLINMVVNVGGQLMNQVLLFISRMVFIHYLSAAYLGVNGLFTDVLGILNLAELGVGTAMIYSLYEPAAKNDEHRLAQLMNLYRLLYRIVAVVVLLVGLALMPFLGFFIKDSSGIEHLRLIYLMYVANSGTIGFPSARSGTCRKAIAGIHSRAERRAADFPRRGDGT